MSDIGIFGGRGVSEEIYLQNARCQYTVLDEIDIEITKNYRRLKFLIFPSRLTMQSRLCFEAMQKNSNFQFCIERFLSHGGRILFCPHSALPSDFHYIKDEDQNSLVIDWLPIKGLELQGTVILGTGDWVLVTGQEIAT